jgi:hypothetical protein
MYQHSAVVAVNSFDAALNSALFLWLQVFDESPSRTCPLCPHLAFFRFFCRRHRCRCTRRVGGASASAPAEFNPSRVTSTARSVSPYKLSWGLAPGGMRREHSSVSARKSCTPADRFLITKSSHMPFVSSSWHEHHTVPLCLHGRIRTSVDPPCAS